MKLRSKDLLGDGLRRWRHERGWKISDIADRCGVKPAAVSKWERSQAYPSFATFVEKIFPAYEIEDITQFIEYISSNQAGVDDVEVIRESQLNRHHETFGVVTYPARRLGGNAPFVIDRVRIDDRSKAVYPVGHGFRYLLVEEGRLEVTLAQSGQERVETLGAGDALVFPADLVCSLQTHEDPANILICRPAWSEAT